MNASEASALLAHASAFDNRRPSQAASEAWAAALHDVPFDEDTLAAVARYYGTADAGDSEVWIQPHHVRAHRTAVRNERLGPPGPGLSPAIPAADPDDVPAYLAALREQNARAAAGHEIPALAAGEEPAGYDNNPHVQAIIREFDAKQAEARRRKLAEQAAEREALTAYRAAVEALAAMPDHGEGAINAALDDLLSPEQAAAGFPLRDRTPGVTDRQKATVLAAQALRLTPQEQSCATDAE